MRLGGFLPRDSRRRNFRSMVITMTVSQLCQEIEKRLSAGECDSPAFDACCLLEDLGGLGRGNVPRMGDTVLPDEVCRRLLVAADRRAAGEPLQYLLGTWDFLDLTLTVGEGVLIPRPETELLCEVAADRLRSLPTPRVLDLCAGSGCVGLGIASLCPSVTVTALEKSPQAMTYLRRNMAAYPQLHVTAREADVLHDAAAFEETVDAVVSNPPYIPSTDLDGLQREVQHEPSMALDGGEDGLAFYRVIARDWTTKIRRGGFVAVEIGIGQAEDVSRLFAEAGLINIQKFPDFSGIDRVICGEKA